jgi:hypothetical protein
MVTYTDQTTPLTFTVRGALDFAMCLEQAVEQIDPDATTHKEDVIMDIAIKTLGGRINEVLPKFDAMVARAEQQGWSSGRHWNSSGSTSRVDHPSGVGRDSWPILPSHPNIGLKLMTQKWWKPPQDDDTAPGKQSPASKNGSTTSRKRTRPQKKTTFSILDGIEIDLEDDQVVITLPSKTDRIELSAH